MGKRKARGDRPRRFVLLAAGLLFAVGLGVLAYPHVCQVLFDQQARHDESAFVEQRDGALGQGAVDPRLDELFRFLTVENERLAAEGQAELADPFAYEQPAIDLSAYGLPDNRIGYVRIEAMGAVLPLYLGASEANMALGAVHLIGSSYPVGGLNANAVIAAHRGYAQAALFRDVESLREGDEVEVENFRETLIYRVVETRVVDPGDFESVKIQPGRDLVTLSTCHPYGSNEYRFLVICERAL
ncbi:MAG: class C sortase [Gordonibacter sp.]